MKFKTPCFVRIENADERDQLMTWCANIGYETNTCRLPPLVCYVFTDGNFAGRCGEKAIGSLPTNAIDCGTNVELFKALAAITEAPRHFRNQWVIAEDGNMCFCDFNDPCQLVIRGMLPHNIGLRKATAEEIIAHFKNR